MAANGSSTNQDVARTQMPLSSSLLADHDLLARFFLFVFHNRNHFDGDEPWLNPINLPSRKSMLYCYCEEPLQFVVEESLVTYRSLNQRRRPVRQFGLLPSFPSYMLFLEPINRALLWDQQFLCAAILFQAITEGTRDI
ncbi:hypothetical protein ACFE04_021352 [Oxalis oulophora]